MRYVESLNAALHQLMAEDERVFLLGEDLLDPYGGAFKATKGLSTAFPDRVLTTPVSEAGMTGFATGMALLGLRPILEIMFGDFLTLCADQIINGASKFSGMYNGQVKVPLIIRTPMGGRRGYGPTHSQTLESLFFSVPGLRIIAPSHYHHPGQLLRRAVLETEEPVLFIENKLLYPERLQEPGTASKVGDFFSQELTAHSKEYPSISLALTKGERPMATLVTYGGMTPFAAMAALNVFMRDEISVEIIIPSLIKPFPTADVLPSLRESGRLVIAEEGVRTSGWGAELASQLYEAAFDVLVTPIERVGSKEMIIPNAKSLEDHVLPQAADIEAAIYRQIER